MSARARMVVDPVADLRRRLARCADRPHVLREAVLRWWQQQGLAEHSPAVGKRIALTLLAQPRGELARAGLIVLRELVADQLGVGDLPAFAALLAGGTLRDEALVDEVAVDVLGALLVRGPGRVAVARGLAAWRDADTVWQRRAGCVAFTVLAAQGDAALPGLRQMIITTCATLVWSLERLDQTAVGWLLRELSRAEPARVAGFFRRHAHFMSRACARLATEQLPDRAELMAHWKRATSLGR